MKLVTPLPLLSIEIDRDALMKIESLVPEAREQLEQLVSEGRLLIKGRSDVNVVPGPVLQTVVPWQERLKRSAFGRGLEPAEPDSSTTNEVSASTK